jgi:hypothetical protein
MIDKNLEQRMARESELQRMVLDFFEETLGYRIRQPHLVSRGLLIRDDVIGFMRSNVNKKSLINEAVSGVA